MFLLVIEFLNVDGDFCIYRRLVEFNEEEEGVNCKIGFKLVRFVGFFISI